MVLNLLPSGQAGASAGRFSPNLTAGELIAEVNDLRAAENLPPYKTNSILMTIAQAQADYLANAGVMTHFNAGGIAPFQRAITAGYSVAGDLSQGGLFLENIGSGAELTASDMVGIWQEDVNDLKVLVSADLVDVGAGAAVVDGITYYVLDAGAATIEPATPSPSVTGTPPVGLVINTPLEDGTLYHQVQANEGLWSIALNYNTTIEALKSLNGLSTDEIFEGQKILIRKPEAATLTPTLAVTATFGIPTSTATHPVTPTLTATETPLPVAPTSRESGGLAAGIIILAALIAAGVGSWLGRKKST